MTHNGDYNGIAPTGKRVILRGIMFLRFSDDQVRECWLECDIVGLMRQLGATTLESQI
jgi:predicted ester cyclase